MKTISILKTSCLWTISHFPFSILFILLPFASCDMINIELDYNLKTELDISTLAFPPKLSVTANFDRGMGNFSILIAEGRSLADFVEPQPKKREIVRDGEIRLFEDGKLILSVPGPIDMSYIPAGGYRDEHGNWVRVQPYHWYSFEKSGISTQNGSVYRLEVEVDGYQTATSTMTMPAIPVVSASIDTSVQVLKHVSRESKRPQMGIGDIQFWLNSNMILLPDGSFEVWCWPVSVHLTDPNPNANNYFVMELYHNVTDYSDISMVVYKGIGVSDMSILQDNPDMEVSRGGLTDANYADFYTFSFLLMSDLSFSGKTGSLTFYSVKQRFSHHNINLPYYMENPDWEKFVEQRKTILSVKHIPEMTFKHYYGQELQKKGIGFFNEPVAIASNIENGYGCFSVYHSVLIDLLEYEFEDLRYVGDELGTSELTTNDER